MGNFVLEIDTAHLGEGSFEFGRSELHKSPYTSIPDIQSFCIEKIVPEANSARWQMPFRNQPW
jgi:hypothetical protein